jgi:molybdopterin molybdotransferase
VTSVEEHARTIERLLEGVLKHDDTETLPIAEALGRITAARVPAPVDLPLFRNSQMDGFAVRAADLGGVPVTLAVVGDIPAGPATPAALCSGTAVRIMTGAVVPQGADCVVPVEVSELSLGPTGTLDGATVTIDRAPNPGEFIREQGSDLHRGDLLLPAGIRLAPRHLAALAAVGQDTVDVRCRVRVAVITTGAELVPAGASAGDGQVFDANRVALAAAIVEAGAELVLAGSSDDNTSEFLRLLRRATDAADIVITSGGISQGAYEVVRESLEPLGAVVCHVDMQPGGPQATAEVDGVPVVCFPGNPVSTQVSFVVFLRPILRRAAGLPDLPSTIRRLAEPLASVPGKRRFLRGRILEGGSVQIVGGPSSHLVAAMARADVLLDIPLDVADLSAGEDVRVWAL